MTLSVDKMRDPKGGSQLLELCERLIERAKQKGATDAEAYAEYGKSATVSLEQNDVKGGQVDEHQAMGLRVFVGDKMGFAYVNRFDDASLDEALDDALTIARTSPGDPANGLVDPTAIGPVPGLWDEAVLGFSPDDVVRFGAGMLAAARGVDKRVSIDTGSFTVSYGHDAIATTKGVRASSGGTGAVYGLFGMAVDGEEVGSFDHVYQGSVRLADVDADALGREFGEKVVHLLHPRESRPYRGAVLFSSEAFEEIFVGTLLDACDGDNVFKGKSRLKEKLGEKVAAPGLSLVDDGTLPGGLRSSPFDREGLPHRRTPIVEGGVLKAFLYDGKAARRAGTRPTGHAGGSARSLPGISTTNLTVLPGDVSEEELLKRLGSGLFVGRFSGTNDAVSGDFSGVAKGSFWVEGGERKHAVKETLIAGNAITLLESIVGLGSKLHRDFAYEGPWVLIDGVDVTSGA